MNSIRVVGLMMLFAGIILFIFGISASQTVTEKVVESVSGRYTEHTMWYIIGGIVLMIGGSALMYTNRRRS
ncbi:MAG: DUF3185 family protein [Rhabdochlamydiaceae bacterium]|nr:DUF3185 family protein [Rhabdochlamydiaceae bacterium]